MSNEEGKGRPPAGLAQRMWTGSTALGETSEGDAAVTASRAGLGRLQPRRSLAEEVAELIREFVLVGGLRPGAKVSDTVLSTDLGVGRGTVREALMMLLVEGFVERAGKGLRVATLEPSAVPDVFQLRLALETWSARNLAAGHADDDLGALERVLVAIDEAAASGRADDVARLDLQFHDTLCRRGGGTQVQKVFRREVAKMLALLRVDVDIYGPLAETTQELWPAVRSMRAGDEAEAAAWIERHMAHSLRSVMLAADARADADAEV